MVPRWYPYRSQPTLLSLPSRKTQFFYFLITIIKTKISNIFKNRKSRILQDYFRPKCESGILLGICSCPLLIIAKIISSYPSSLYSDINFLLEVLIANSCYVIINYLIFNSLIHDFLSVNLLTTSVITLIHWFFSSFSFLHVTSSTFFLLVVFSFSVRFYFQIMPGSLTAGETITTMTLFSLVFTNIGLALINRIFTLLPLSIHLEFLLEFREIFHSDDNLFWTIQVLLTSPFLFIKIFHYISSRFFVISAFMIFFSIIYPTMFLLFRQEPISWLFFHFFSSSDQYESNFLICFFILFWGILLIMGIIYIPRIIIFMNLRNITIIRKLFHFLAYIMFMPSVIYVPRLLSLSFALSFALMVIFEFLRNTRTTPFGHRIHLFYSPYLSVQDVGDVIVSHIYLLIGCALPVWMNGDVHYKTTPSIIITSLSGITVLGLSDSFASIFGTIFGKTRTWWPPIFSIRKSQCKTIEGSIAAFFILIISFIPFIVVSTNLIPNFLLACIIVCLVEAMTTQIDNLYLPIIFYSALLILL